MVQKPKYLQCEPTELVLGLSWIRLEISQPTTYCPNPGYLILFGALGLLFGLDL